MARVPKTFPHIITHLRRPNALYTRMKEIVVIDVSSKEEPKPPERPVLCELPI